MAQIYEISKYMYILQYPKKALFDQQTAHTSNSTMHDSTYKEIYNVSHERRSG